MDTPSFDQEVVRLRPLLKSLTHRFTQDAEESMDLVQDTILKALLYRDKFRQDTNLKGWLFTIMRNTFINNYRRHKRSGTHRDLTPAATQLHLEDHYTFTRPENTFEFNEVWTNVNGIREDLLIPFKMYTTGYKYHEIAEHLQVPVGTVKNRIFQARKEIQKRLHGYR